MKAVGDQAADKVIRRMAEDVSRGVELTDLSLIQDQHACAQIERLPQIVGDEDDGDAV